jgi:hypothetical protein
MIQLGSMEDCDRGSTKSMEGRSVGPGSPTIGIAMGILSVIAATLMGAEGAVTIKWPLF